MAGIRLPKINRRWVGYHLPSLILIPLGVFCLGAGVFALSSNAGVADTLIVIGAGMAVFGSFSPRLRGRQRLGPGGVDITLADEMRDARDRGLSNVTAIEEAEKLKRLVEDLRKLGVLPPDPSGTGGAEDEKT